MKWYGAISKLIVFVGLAVIRMFYLIGEGVISASDKEKP
jgi:hypothetical protein